MIKQIERFIKEVERALLSFFLRTMPQEPTLQNLEKARDYFSALYQRVLSQGYLRTLEGRATVDEYFNAIFYAVYASRQLNNYGREELSFLASNGFTMDATILIGVAQDSVLLDAERSISTKIPALESDRIEQTLRVLSSYIHLRRYEERVEDFRKLRAVEEAMQRQGR